jgi:iron complex transport system permease protein
MKHWFGLALLGLVLLITMAVASGIGAANIPMAGIANVLTGGGSEVHKTILLQIRFPRVLQSAVVGLGLSVCGAFFQGLLANPLADPYILGLSSGAAFGAAIAITLGLGIIGIQFFAFVAALATIYVVITLAGISSRSNAVTMLLSGVAVSTFLSAVISFMMLLSNHKLASIVFWTMGGFNLVTWREVLISSPVILTGSFVMYLFARDLNAVTLGRETAEHLGIDTGWFGRIILVCGSLVTATAVSVSGIVGFVGLMIPHITRLIVGPDNRILVPYSAVIGSIFLVFADTLSRTVIQPAEIPIGIITAAFGGPFFIYILRRNVILNRG